MKFKLILLTIFYIPVSLISIPSEEKMEIIRVAALSGSEGLVPFVGSVLCSKRDDALRSNIPTINVAAHSVGLLAGVRHVRRHVGCNRATMAMLFATNIGCLALKTNGLINN
ncbi:MAG TPA: hypothetical protein QGF02_02560 [Candidatus Babeliales bacterium]|nr:hypothetical protein [Candidatus Babeliales bacterium]